MKSVAYNQCESVFLRNKASKVIVQKKGWKQNPTLIKRITSSAAGLFLTGCTAAEPVSASAGTIKLKNSRTRF